MTVGLEVTSTRFALNFLTAAADACMAAGGRGGGDGDLVRGWGGGDRRGSR